MRDLLLQDLKREVSEKQAVIIAGAGIAIQATENSSSASWVGLLHNGAERCGELDSSLIGKWLEVVHWEVDSGDLDNLLSAAEKITRKLGGRKGPEFARWLRETVGALKPTNDGKTILDAIKALQLPIATTNYDGLLESITGFEAVSWNQGSRVERVLRGDEKGILHLHGFWSDPNSVILGIRSYEDAIGDEHAQTILRALRSTRTLVFVGFGEGLRDPNIGGFIHWASEIFPRSEYRMFRLALDSEREALQKMHPPEERIYVLGYGSTHKHLANFLNEIRDPQRGSEDRPPSPSRNRRAPIPSKPRCFGRDKEIETLVGGLITLNPQPSPVLGPPGIGKSTLCLAALHDERVASKFRERRYFVRCDAIRSREALAMEIGRMLMIDSAPALEDALLLELGSSPAVLAIDNAETPWDEDTLGVEELLSRIAELPGLALIITARGNERPAGVSWLDAVRPSPLSAHAARQTFLSIAGSRFQEDLGLERLLQAVDRVPLAVTLLAHAAEAEPDLTTLLERWQQERTEMLRRGDASDRLSNLELSYKLSITGKRMTDSARRLLNILSVLPNGMDIKHLERVLSEGSQAAAWTLRRTGLAFDEGNRLRLLAPLREFVRRTSQVEPEDAERVTKFYLELAQANAPQVGRVGGGDAVSRLASEVDNIEECMLLALQRKDSAEILDAVLAWVEIFLLSGLGSSRPCTAALRLARSARRGDVAAKCLMGLGQIALNRADREQAQEYLAEALPLLKSVNDRVGEAKCICILGDVSLGWDQELAKSRYEEARALYAAIPDMSGEAVCLERLADISLRHSDHVNASSLYSEAIAIYRALGAVFGEATCIQRLGDVAWERSELELAGDRYKSARELFRLVGAPLGEANCTQRLGDISLSKGDRETARRSFETALLAHRQLRLVAGEANCLKSLGELAKEEHKYEDARRHFDRAILLYRMTNAVLGEANCYQRLGDIETSLFSYTQAIKSYDAALALYEQIDQRFSIGWTHMRLADIETDRRQYHRTAARDAWAAIGRIDLLSEFGEID